MIDQSALEPLRQILGRVQSGSKDQHDITVAQIAEAQEKVRARYVPVFSPEHLDELDAETFKGFLQFKNNQHWGNLQRQGATLTADMSELRGALKTLTDESMPLRARLNQLRPRKGSPKVKGLARTVITAILQVLYPQKYGVYNSTAEQGMKMIGIWPNVRAAASLADRYEAMNQVLLEVSDALSIDLWTLDSLWWRITIGANGEPPPDSSTGGNGGDSPVAHGTGFGLEKHLHEFLVDNWSATQLGQEWDLLEEDGEIKGSEYNTGEVGRIDLLAKHKTDARWLVVELKRGKSSDRTVGQLLRYTGWVRQKMATAQERVEGLIICRDVDLQLQYALDSCVDVRCMAYRVQFTLNDLPDL